MKRPASATAANPDSKWGEKNQKRNDRDAGIYSGGCRQQAARAAKEAKAAKPEMQQSGLAQYLVSKWMWQPVSLG